MSSEAINPKEYLDTNADGKVEGQEMLTALKDFPNREKVWKNVQEFLKTPEAVDAKQELKDLSEKEIKNICAKTDNTVDRLLSMVWKANGTYWGEQVYTGEFVGQKITSEDRSYYGILCLYDQLVGKNANTSGRGYFKDAQYWLRKTREDQINAKLDEVTDADGNKIVDADGDGIVDEPKKEQNKEKPTDKETVPEDKKPKTEGKKDEWNEDKKPKTEGKKDEWNEDKKPKTEGKKDEWNEDKKPKTEGKKDEWNEDKKPKTEGKKDEWNDDKKPKTEGKKDERVDPTKQTNIEEKSQKDIKPDEEKPKEEPKKDKWEEPKKEVSKNTPPKNPEVVNKSIQIQYVNVPLNNTNMPNGIDRGVIRKWDTNKGEWKHGAAAPGYDFDRDAMEGDFFFDNAGTQITVDTKNGSKVELINFTPNSTNIKKIKTDLEAQGRELVMVTPVAFIEANTGKTQGPCIVDGRIENTKMKIVGDKGTINGKEVLNLRGDNGAVVIKPDGTIEVIAIDMRNESQAVNDITTKYAKKGYTTFPAPLLIHNSQKYANIYGQTDDAQKPETRKPYRIQGIDKNGKLVTQDYKEAIPLESVIKSNIAAGFKEMRYVDIRYSQYTKEGGFCDKNGVFYPYRGDPQGSRTTEFNYDNNWIKAHQNELQNQPFDHTNVMIVSTPKQNKQEQSKTPEIKKTNPAPEKENQKNEIAQLDVDNHEKTLRNIITSDITLEKMVYTVNDIADIQLRSKVIEKLEAGAAVEAMQLVGMKQGSTYPNNAIRADGKIDAIALEAFARPHRMHKDYEFFIDDKNTDLVDDFDNKAKMPQDVKDAYRMFAYQDLADQKGNALTQRIAKPERQVPFNHKNYVILSKTDGHLYLFDKSHHLVSRKSALMGEDPRDDKVDAFATGAVTVQNGELYFDSKKLPKRTPAGLYSINNKTVEAGIGDYAILQPQSKLIGLPNRMPYILNTKTQSYLYTIGIHPLYDKVVKEKRAERIQSPIASEKFISNGCVNVGPKLFGEMRDHIEMGDATTNTPGSFVYITENPKQSA